MRTNSGGRAQCPPPFELRVLHESQSNIIDRVVSLVNRCYRGHELWTNEAAIVSGLRTTRQAMINELSAMDVLVAVPLGEGDVEDPKVLGCVKTGVVSETVAGPLTGDPAAYLGMLAVSAEVQSCGLGTALVLAVERRAKSIYGCQRVVLDVLDCRTDLVEWYTRIGYCPTGLKAPARPFMENKGENLLIDCCFTLLEKPLGAKSIPCT